MSAPEFKIPEEIEGHLRRTLQSMISKGIRLGQNKENTEQDLAMLTDGYTEYCLGQLESNILHHFEVSSMRGHREIKKALEGGEIAFMIAKDNKCCIMEVQNTLKWILNEPEGES